MTPSTLADAIDAGRVEVVVEGMGFRGEGFIAFDDGWLSIPGALPGERVIVDVENPGSRRRRRVFGTLVEVVDASDRRVDPRCARVRSCRGCQLRHVSVLDELAIKADAVVECLTRYAGVDPAALPPVQTITVPGATRADAFRVRTALSVTRGTNGWLTGLRAPFGQLVPMTDCPALADATQRAVSRVDLALAEAPPSLDRLELRQIRVASPVHGHGYVDVEVDRHDAIFDPLLEALDRHQPEGFGIAITDGRERRHVRGPRRFRLPMADLKLEVGFDDWFHATLEPAERLYDELEAWLDVQPGERVIDAGCGIGTIGLLCARSGADVVGFDINPASVETAELNAINNDLHVELRASGWERAFRDLVLEERTFDTVVINPMREPLGERPLTYASRLATRRIVYLGPSAAPAAKDIGLLLRSGWRLTRICAVNLHPATYHVMLAALLEAPPASASR